MESPLYWRTAVLAKNEFKLQTLELIRDGEISSLYGTWALKDFSQKCSLVLDLLKDLRDLHAMKISNPIIKNERGETLDSLPAFNLFHGDISLSNVLIFKKETWRAELIDFGASTDPSVLGRKLGYASPELVRYVDQLSSLSSIEEVRKVVEFNSANGQKRDIWSLALVFLSLLVEENKTIEIRHKKTEGRGVLRKVFLPPPASLQACFSKDTSSRDIEKKVAFVKQVDLDRNLSNLKRRVHKLHPEAREEVERLFLLLQTMLRVDPEERKPVADLLSMLEDSHNANSIVC